jgi:hypothetical protein
MRRTMATLVAAVAATMITVGLVGTADAAPGDVVGGPGSSADPGGPTPVRLTIATASNSAFDNRFRWTVSGTFPLPPDAPFSCQLVTSRTSGRVGFSVVLMGNFHDGFTLDGPVALESCVRTAQGVDLRVSRLKERSAYSAKDVISPHGDVWYFDGRGSFRLRETNVVKLPLPPVAASADATRRAGLR